MTFDTARSPANVRWRKSIANQDLVAIGVEFRNEGLSPGHQPFPAGLNDCVTAVQWVYDNRDTLGISSGVLLGEAGGANLAIATGIKANMDGWINVIQGVYAIAPMIYGFYDGPPPELMSWRENLGLMGSHATCRAIRIVYDPDSVHRDNPLVFPFCAKTGDLKGPPPPHLQPPRKLHGLGTPSAQPPSPLHAPPTPSPAAPATIAIGNGLAITTHTITFSRSAAPMH